MVCVGNRACWDPFEDMVLNITGYSVQAFEQQDGNADPPVSPLVFVGLNATADITGLHLMVRGCPRIAMGHLQSMLR